MTKVRSIFVLIKLQLFIYFLVEENKVAQITEITDSVTRGEIAQDLRGGDSSLMTALHPRGSSIFPRGALWPATAPRCEEGGSDVHNASGLLFLRRGLFLR